jgi:protocatechuate 3,4-dioxygenase beta subunit
MQKGLSRLLDADAPLAETLSALTHRDRPRRRHILQGLAAAGLLASSPLRALMCSTIPSETGGPFPADGTNGPNALAQSGILRSDIRASFGSAGSAVASGTPVTISLQITNANDGCVPLGGCAVYLWHCNATGGYSLYSPGVTDQNYLRGVQVTDATGHATFTSIYPACYSGRWPHIHFEIYASVADAVSGTKAVKTSQLALPESTSRDVYAQTALYPSSAANLNQTSLASDFVFSEDRGVHQIPTVTGSAADGYAIALSAGIALRRAQSSRT